MTTWYDYERARFLRNQFTYLDTPLLNPDQLELLEGWIGFNWDGSQYHCMAHLFGVANTALEIADSMSVSQDWKKIIIMAGLFHDAGRRAINDAENISVASGLFNEYNLMYPDDEYFFDSAENRILVYQAMKGTQFPSPGRIMHTHAKILRDADFASTLTPEPIIEEIRQALADEMGGPKQTDYEFVISQKAYLVPTVNYYKQHGLTIELLERK